MNILFVSNYFPPEVNAPATRVYELARVWAEAGHHVEVLTSVPNFPEGEVYEGYENRATVERMNGIVVRRVPMYVTPNEGVIKRTLSYMSFMASARWYARDLEADPDVVVATSPQFFAAIAGHWIARARNRPLVLEIRDLWPESVVAVGAMDRNIVIRFFERIEEYLYRRSGHIVALTHAFKRSIAEKGIASSKITVIENGVDVDEWSTELEKPRLEELRRAHDLEGKFVVSYIGTIGMAHKVDVLLDAAEASDDPDLVFMIVGAGAERGKLEARLKERELPNVRLLDKVPKDVVPYLLELTDASLVHLRDSPLFETVIPSKIFEAMATRTPIILGVRGESREIIERSASGIPVAPEAPDEIVDAAGRLKSDPAFAEQLGENGYRHVSEHYDRRKLAERYASLLERVGEGREADISRPAPVG